MNDLRAEIKRMLAVVAYLNAAVANTRLYAVDHPQVARCLERVHVELGRILKFRPELTFMLVDHDLVVDQRPFPAKTAHVSQFVEILSQRGVERLTFTAGLTLPELTQLACELAAGDSGVRSTATIKLGKVSIRGMDSLVDDAELSPEMRQRIEQMELIRDLSLEQLKELYHQLKTSRRLPVSAFERIVQAFIRGLGSQLHPLHVLAHLKSSDQYTFTHAINVCILTMAQAQSLGVEGRSLNDIGIAAALHDAGKMFVPDEILNKPGKLSDEEWVHMRSHSIRGARQLLRMEGLPKLAFIGALEHHIRFDGTGYPVIGRRPNPISQMIAISDMFDAMRSRRPYQPPKPDQLILQILQKESGTSFHPLLVENFLRLIKRR